MTRPRIFSIEKYIATIGKRKKWSVAFYSIRFEFCLYSQGIYLHWFVVVGDHKCPDQHDQVYNRQSDVNYVMLDHTSERIKKKTQCFSCVNWDVSISKREIFEKKNNDKFLTRTMSTRSNNNCLHTKTCLPFKIHIPWQQLVWNYLFNGRRKESKLDISSRIDRAFNQYKQMIYR